MEDPRPWARGKTVSEVLGIAETLNTTVSRYISSPPPPAAAPPAPVQPQNGLADDQIVYGADLNRFAPAAIDQRLASQINPVYDTMASMAQQTVRSKYAAEFASYGPEINAMWASIQDKRQHTVDNLEMAVKVVLTNHLDEIASQRAQRLVQERPETLRSLGAAPPAVAPQPDHSLQSEKLPADWKNWAQQAGLTEQAIDEFCRGNEMSREQFFGQFAKRGIITEVSFRKQ